MSVRFIKDEPALAIEDSELGNILVIADLHLGFESELYHDGIVIAPQSEKLYKMIVNLIDSTNSDTLVILGDLKHKIPGISFREMTEIPKLVSPLSEKVDIILVKGNHDTELKNLIPDNVEIHESGGFKLGKYGFLHGHAWPNKNVLKADHLLTAHIHPIIEFVDDLGFRIVEKIWAKGDVNKDKLREKYKIEGGFRFGNLETIFFPVFNPIISGYPLNRSGNDRYIGPLLRNKIIDADSLEIYMLDGTSLGKLANI